MYLYSDNETANEDKPSVASNEWWERKRVYKYIYISI